MHPPRLVLALRLRRASADAQSADTRRVGCLHALSSFQRTGLAPPLTRVSCTALGGTFQGYYPFPAPSTLFSSDDEESLEPDLVSRLPAEEYRDRFTLLDLHCGLAPSDGTSREYDRCTARVNP